MSYLWIGYGLTWAALALYTWSLERRHGEARRELSFVRESRGGPGDEAGSAGDDRAGHGAGGQT